MCFTCDKRYDASVDGAGPLRCRACGALGRLLVTETEAEQMRLLAERILECGGNL